MKRSDAYAASEAKVGPMAQENAEEETQLSSAILGANIRITRAATRRTLKFHAHDGCKVHDGQFGFEVSEKNDRRGRRADDDDDDDDDGELVGDRKNHKHKPVQPPVFQPFNVANEHAHAVVPMRILSVVLLNVALCFLCMAQWEAEKGLVLSLEERVLLSPNGFNIDTEECFVSFAPVPFDNAESNQPVARVLAPCRGSALVCALRTKLAVPKLKCDAPREEGAERTGRPSTRDDDDTDEDVCLHSDGVADITVRAPSMSVAPPGSCEVIIEWPLNVTLPPVNMRLRGGSLTRAGDSAALASEMLIDKLKVTGYAGHERGGVELAGLSIKNGGSLNISLTRGHVEVYGLKLADGTAVEVRLRALAHPSHLETSAEPCWPFFNARVPRRVVSSPRFVALDRVRWPRAATTRSSRSSTTLT